MHECFPKHARTEQQEWNKIEKQTKKVKKGMSMKKSIAGEKWVLPEYHCTQSKYNNNKHDIINMAVFYKICTKYN